MINSIELLPYSNQILMNSIQLKIRILLLIRFILLEVLEAIDDFYFRNKFLKFDAHVGENLCQIRACQIFELSRFIGNKSSIIYFKKKEYRKFKLILSLVNEKIFEYENIAKSNREIQKDHLIHNEKLTDFLQKQNLIFEISEETCFLMQSHFLSKFKNLNNYGNTIIDYESLNKYIGVSKNISRQIIHIYQLSLSKMSCQFIFDCLEKIGHNFYSKTLLRAMRQYDDDKREVLPSFLVMDILLEYLRQMECNLFIIIKSRDENISSDQITLFYSPCKETKSFLHSNVHCSDPESPCIVFYGITDQKDFNDYLEREYIEKFDKLGIENIILANMAAHPQYSGKVLEYMKENPFMCINFANDPVDQNELAKLNRKFNAMKLFAKSKGLMISNDIFYHIRHIFFSTIGQQMEIQLKEHYNYIGNHNEDISRSESLTNL